MESESFIFYHLPDHILSMVDGGFNAHKTKNSRFDYLLSHAVFDVDFALIKRNITL